MYRPTWIEIDREAIAHNVREIKARIGHQTMMAVVKADVTDVMAIADNASVVHSTAAHALDQVTVHNAVAQVHHVVNHVTLSSRTTTN